jgi:alanine racemase
LDALKQVLKNTRSVKVASLFSHLAASEDLEEREFTLQQIQDFKVLTASVSSAIGYTPMLHMSNTSAILNYPETHFDMVRAGIGLYGYGNSKKESQFLKPIARLKTVISQIHTNGNKAPIIGNVCMDMIMVNVTGIACEEGDEVVVFDAETTSAEALAASANTISYELITSISQRVKRVILIEVI